MKRLLNKYNIWKDKNLILVFKTGYLKLNNYTGLILFLTICFLFYSSFSFIKYLIHLKS